MPHRPRTIWRRHAAALAAVGVAVALAPAGAARVSSTQLSLVAYSTPRAAYGQLIPAFQKTAAGKDVTLHAVVRRVGRSGARRGRRPQGGRRRTSRSLPTSTTREGGHRLQGLEEQAVSRHGHGLDRRLRPPRRQPEAHQDVDRPPEAGRPGRDTPNPFTSGGARWNIMAAYGAWRRERKTDKQAQANLLKLFKNVVVQDKSARDALNTFLAGKGDVLLAYENEALLAKAAGQPVQFVIPRSTILIENPIAVTRTTENAAAGERVHEVPRHARRAADLREQRLPAGREERPREEQEEVPGPAGACSRSTRSRSAAGRRRRSASSTPTPGIMAKHREAGRWRHRLSTLAAPSRPGAGSQPRDRAATALSARLCHDLPRRSSFCCRSRRSSGRRRARARSRSGTRSRTRRRSPRSSSRSLPRFSWRSCNAVLGTLTAWVLVRDDFRGKSVVNAVIDLPFALPTIVAGLTLLALYGPKSPVGIDVAYTRSAIVLCLLFVTLPFVVRTVQPLLDRARPRARAGRALPRRSAAGRPSAGSSCPRSCPGSCRESRSRSRKRWASSDPS